VAPIPGDIGRVLTAVYPQWQEQEKDWVVLEDDQDYHSTTTSVDKSVEGEGVVDEDRVAVVEGGASPEESAPHQPPAVMSENMVKEIYGQEYLQYL